MSAAPAPGPGAGRLEELRAEARYHRQRYELYRARVHGSRPTRLSRLRELQRAHEFAAARLTRATTDGEARS
jgi:hypothetical protein